MRALTFVLTIFVLTACFAVFARGCWMWSLYQARRRGKIPEQGKATLYDVRRLLQSGDKETAVRLYCEIFRVTPTQARKDVQALERSLKT